MIGNSKATIITGLTDLWQKRELIFFLAQRDVKVRYKQTILGIGWALLQPLTTVLSFWLFLGKLGRIPSDGVPYGLFVFTGVLIWNFFSSTVTITASSILNYSHLITKVYFPRIIIPVSSVGLAIFDMCISASLMLIFLLAYRIPLTWEILLAPIIMLFAGFAALGCGLISMGFSSRYRDVRYAMPFILQFAMYASPVVYPSSQIPQKWREILVFNPLTGLIEAFRASILGRPIEWRILGLASVEVTAILLVGLFVFQRTQHKFTDTI